MIIKSLFKTSIFIVLLLLATFLVYTIAVGYENFVSEFIEYFKYEKYEKQIKLILTQDKFYYMQILIFILLLSLTIVLKYIDIILQRISTYFKDLTSSFYRTIDVLHDKHNVLVILLPTLTIVYYAIKMPISYDEAWTYLNFSSRNLIVSLTYYPAPNNHVLHSLLTNITNFIFPTFPLFALRLPPVIVSFMTYLIGLYSIKKHYNKNISIASVGIFSVLFMGIYYGYMSRGYALILFFFIASFHFVLNIIKNANNLRDWICFTIFSILGFFTIPSYLYAFATLNVILLFLTLKKSVFINQVKYSIITFIATAILYLPIIVVNGLKALTNNRFVAPKPREFVFSKLPEFLFQTIEEITGLNGILLLSMIIISLLLLLKNKDWFHTKLFTLFLIMPPFLLLTHGVIPFSRTFNYYSFIVVLLFCIANRNFLEKLKIRILVLIVIFLQILLIYNFNEKIFNYEKYSIISKEINNKIISENKSYLVNSNLFGTYLLYYLKAEKITSYKEDHYYLKPENVTNYTEDPILQILVPNISADTISKKYNFIIIDKIVDKTKKKKPVYSNEYFNVYEEQ